MYESLYSSFISPFIIAREFMVKMMRTCEAISKNPYNPRSNFGKLSMLLLDREITPLRISQQISKTNVACLGKKLARAKEKLSATKG